MRGIVPGRALAVVALLALKLGAAEVRPAPAEWRVEPFLACDADPCAFQDPAGANRYVIAKGELSRTTAGAEVYRRTLAGKYEKVLLSGLTAAGNQLAVVIARERISARGRDVSGLRIDPRQAGPSPRTGSGQAPLPPMAHPQEVEREHRVEVVNPKSGETVKSLDLGAFRPEGLALSAHGELILLHGKDLQLGTHQVRLYNTRSGKLEHQATVERSAGVTLAANGYTVGGARWVVGVGEAKSELRFNSRDPYSIAEYAVECSGLLTAGSFQGKTLAVVKFTGADFEVGQMLSNGLALKLRNAGFSLAERQGMEEILEEIYLQSSGLTGEDQAATIGKLVNAQLLAFGGLRQAGTTSSLTVRLVSVEEGKLVSGCEVACRDCRPDDYLEGLGYLVGVWTGE